MGYPKWIINHIESCGFAYDKERLHQKSFWNGEDYVYIPKGRSKLNRSHVLEILRKCKMDEEAITHFLEKHKDNIIA